MFSSYLALLFVVAVFLLLYFALYSTFCDYCNSFIFWYSLILFWQLQIYSLCLSLSPKVYVQRLTSCIYSQVHIHFAQEYIQLEYYMARFIFTRQFSQLWLEKFGQFFQFLLVFPIVCWFFICSLVSYQFDLFDQSSQLQVIASWYKKPTSL